MQRTVLVFLTLALGVSSFLVGADGRYTSVSVWHPASEQIALDTWHQCSNTDCIVAAMKRLGTGSDPTDFVRAMDGEAYLASFEEKGRVDLGRAIFPSRANTNDAYLLLNGNPEIVSTELKDGVIDLTHQPQYPMLKQRYPEISLWPASAAFLETNQGPDGGQRFVFSYYLINGCHACGVPWAAQVAFDFKKDGSFVGTKLLKIVASK